MYIFSYIYIFFFCVERVGQEEKGRHVWLSEENVEGRIRDEGEADVFGKGIGI